MLPLLIPPGRMHPILQEGPPLRLMLLSSLGAVFLVVSLVHCVVQDFPSTTAAPDELLETEISWTRMILISDFPSGDVGDI